MEEINKNVEKDVVEINESVTVNNKEEVTSDETLTIETIEEKTYTQAEIDALRAEIDDLLQYKPEEKSEAEIKLQEKIEILWSKQVDLELKEQGLEVFKDFIKADVDDTEALNQQILKLKEIVGALKLSNGYQPTNHKPVDAYSIAKKNKSPIDMISAKLNS